MIQYLSRPLHRIVHVLVRLFARWYGRDALWMSITIARVSRRLDEMLWGMVEATVTLPARRKLLPILDHAATKQLTAVDRHWQAHTIRGGFFLSKEASLDYIVELTDGRPYKRKLLRLHGPHPGKTILDYGCGPGNDLAGFAEFSRAARIIGIDISERALRIARARVSWHVTDPKIFTFIKIRDDDTTIPLPDESVDYIQSLGVIHHSSHPDRIFKELARILKPDGEMRVMVYNADSVHVQLTIGYVRRLVQTTQSDLTPEEAFEKTADLEAPIVHCVRPPDVAAWIAGSGLDCEFLGGYFVPGEADDHRRFTREALGDDRLSADQRAFLSALSEDEDSFPMYQGRPAGLSAVYRLTKYGRASSGSEPCLHATRAKGA